MPSRPVVLGRLFFFFFQAEDGIRDTSVTGVQTCALPIFHDIKRHRNPTETCRVSCCEEKRKVDESSRSEERRVGKECRAQWWPDHKKKKKKDDKIKNLLYVDKVLGQDKSSVDISVTTINA